MVTDPIADYLTRMRNAIMAKHRVVEIPASNLKKEMTQILFEKGYILNNKNSIEIPPRNKNAGNIQPHTREQPGIEKICGRGRNAPSVERIRHSYYIHIQRPDDRQRG